jgi:hypothetical protein
MKTQDHLRAADDNILSKQFRLDNIKTKAISSS